MPRKKKAPKKKVNFNFMMTPASQEAMEKRLPEGYPKQRFLENAIEFALRTKRKERLKQKLPQKEVREQVRIEEEMLQKFHALAKELDMSAGHLINVAITRMNTPSVLTGQPPRKKPVSDENCNLEEQV